MTKGVLLFAHDNSRIDYIKQAVYCASRIKRYMNLPVALATDNVDKAKTIDNNSLDIYIELAEPKSNQIKHFYNGVYSTVTLPWYNHGRSDCYDITPFKHTIVMDTDFIVSNSQLNNAFEIDKDVMFYKNICDAGLDRNLDEFKFITDTSIPMWWATVFYFRKTEKSKLFFDLVKHIKDEWCFYRLQYQIVNKNFRNDFAFSIAAHILNGFDNGNFVGKLPGKFWFSSDRDIPLSIDGDTCKLLVDQNNSANYLPVKLHKANIHIMNKIALQEIIDHE